MPKPMNRQSESLKRAIDLAAVDWDNVVIFSSRYDPTTNSTICGMLAQGNTFAIEKQVEDWVDSMSEEFDCCPDCCECGEGDDDVTDEDQDDSLGNH